MPLFSNWGQVLQILIAFAALSIAAKNAYPAMSANNFFSAGAILFYLLVALVFVSLWLAVRKRRETDPPAVITSPTATPSQSVPEQSDYQENLEHKNHFRQFVKRDAKNVWEAANAVMSEVIKKLRRMGGGFCTNYGRSLEYVIRPFNEKRDTLDRILQAEHLSNRDFVTLQREFCVFFREYQIVIGWIRDAGKDATFNFITSESYRKWRTLDGEMRRELKGFLHHPAFKALSGPHDSVENNIEWNDWW